MRRTICRVVGLAAVLGWALLLFGPSTARAQRARGGQARSTFTTVVEAATALAALEPQPADANGSLRAWDRRWRRRLRQFSVRSAHTRCAFAPDSCAEREECALAPGLVAFQVISARDAMLGDLHQHSVFVAAETLAARRLVADEAARRRRAGLSCEDLPSSLDIGDRRAVEALHAPSGFAELRDAQDVQALLALAHGGPSGLRALLEERAEMAAAESRRRLREAEARCDDVEATEELLRRVASGLHMAAVRGDYEFASFGLRAAGFEEDALRPRESRGDPTAGPEHSPRRQEAWNRLAGRDPELARAAVILLAEHEGASAVERLVEMMGRVYHRVSPDDAALLVACLSGGLTGDGADATDGEAATETPDSPAAAPALQ